MSNHLEQIARLRVAFGAEHAHQALRGSSSQPAQLLETDRRVDVVARDRLPSVEVPGAQTVDAFPAKYTR
jgi:hypothetical protein